MNLKHFFQKITSFTLFCIVIAASTNAMALTLINNCSDLQNMRLDIHGEYLLTNDIDCSGFSFSPVGIFEDPFTGVLDGEGHTIRNLSINKNANYIGLFGFTENANIHHLNLENVQIKGRSSVGSLIGEAHETQIIDVSSSGTIEGVSKTENAPSSNMGGLVGALSKNSNVTRSSFSGSVSVITNYVYYGSVGGLIGSANNSFINESHSKGQVYGTNYAGGLIGSVSGNASVTNSYSTANVDVASHYSKPGIFGGLLGQAYQSDTVRKPMLISQCYATGNVGTNSSYPPDTAGGLIGYPIGPSKCPSDFKDCFPRIENNYATGQVHGTNANLGGLIGMITTPVYLVNNYAIGKVSSAVPKGNSVGVGGLVGYSLVSAHTIYDISNYWDIQTSGQPYSAQGYGNQTTQMYQKDSFVGWDFSTIWSINENQSYPSLVQKVGLTH